MSEKQHNPFLPPLPAQSLADQLRALAQRIRAFSSVNASGQPDLLDTAADSLDALEQEKADAEEEAHDEHVRFKKRGGELDKLDADLAACRQALAAAQYELVSITAIMARRPTLDLEERWQKRAEAAEAERDRLRDQLTNELAAGPVWQCLECGVLWSTDEYPVHNHIDYDDTGQSCGIHSARIARYEPAAIASKEPTR